MTVSRRTLGLALVLGSVGCGGKVVKAEARPAEEAVIALDGDERRRQRWTVAPGPHQIEVTWPDGTRISEKVEVRRDIVLVLHRDGRPGVVEGIDQPKAGPARSARDDGEVSTVPAPDSNLTPEQAFAEAKRLFHEGEKAFELAEFDAAIEKFKGAYTLLSDTDSSEYDEILVQVTYNLAVVYERSYDVTPEVERLRRGRVMFQNYDKQMSRTDPKWAGSKEQDDLHAHLQELEARVDKAEGK